MPQSLVICTLIHPIHIKPLWGQAWSCSVSILLMKILRRTEVKLLALLIQVSRTDGNKTCTQEPSRQLIFTFSQDELDNHTPLASFQSWRNIKIWEEGTGNLKLPFFWPLSPDLYKNNSNLRLFFFPQTYNYSAGACPGNHATAGPRPARV